MSVGAKITKSLGNNRYEIEVTPIVPHEVPMTIGVAHDYVMFSSWTYLQTDDNVRISGVSGGASNVIPIQVSLQVPIKIMGQVGLPLMNDSKYLKSEHFGNYGVYSKAPVRTWSEKEVMYNVYDKEKKEFVEIPKSLYNQLTNTKDEQ